MPKTQWIDFANFTFSQHWRSKANINDNRFWYENIRKESLELGPKVDHLELAISFQQTVYANKIYNLLKITAC